MNNFIEKKTNKKIFLKDEQITLEEKIKRIKDYQEEILKGFLRILLVISLVREKMLKKGIVEYITWRKWISF